MRSSEKTTGFAKNQPLLGGAAVSAPPREQTMPPSRISIGDMFPRAPGALPSAASARSAVCVTRDCLELTGTHRAISELECDDVQKGRARDTHAWTPSLDAPEYGRAFPAHSTTSRHSLSETFGVTLNAAQPSLAAAKNT